MERLRIIRETINYAHQFQGALFVVKIDNKVTVDALNAEYLAISLRLRQLGIELITVHSDLDGIGGDNDAVDIAVEKKAHKLIFVTNVKGIFFPPDTLLRQLSVGDARKLLTEPKAVNGSMRGKLEASIRACNLGVDRVHIIGKEEGSLLLEIFTCDGVGTMIYFQTPYEQVKKAESGEINDIMEVLRTTISKSRFNSTLVAKAIGDFWVFTVDKDIHGCVQLTDHPNHKMIEISCLAVSARYENLDVIQRLLRHAIRCAEAKKYQGVFMNIKENTLCLPLYPWFMRLGFKRDVSGQISRIYKNTGTNYWVCPVSER